ncbi:hypothetical protein [Levilinea saccharolytica]|uniref:Uncharacterized protein n=2 Tax=Levilinea saccharolytica TaxID=229921 RepID=A0A0P6YMR3_9CHLR|nr:hypothetical protein [Levilinea saccharolytica]KPL91517.1 hypothetical protein ADN01_00870 [Levilinea saccharolytica]
MRTKINTSIMTIFLVLILAACSGTPAVQAPAQNQSGDPMADFANQPVENKLAVGILSLEGTDKAVTADQAKAMLPLWEAVKSLRTDPNTTAQEISGLYQQIQQTLTPDQVQAIQDLDLDPQEVQALMEKYGLQFQPNAAVTRDPSAMATRIAGRSTNGAAGGPGGGGFEGGLGGGFGGGPGGGMGGGFANGANPPANNGFQGTPQPNPARAGGGFRNGFNALFVDPVIHMLTERSAS